MFEVLNRLRNLLTGRWRTDKPQVIADIAGLNEITLPPRENVELTTVPLAMQEEEKKAWSEREQEMPELVAAQVTLPGTMTLRCSKSQAILTWEHKAPDGHISRVSFGLAFGAQNNGTLNDFIERMLKTYERDYLRERTPSLLNTGFFRAMLVRDKVTLLELDNCRGKMGKIVCGNKATQTTIKNLDIDGGLIKLSADVLKLSNVTIRCGTIVEFHATKSTLESVTIEHGCDLRGDFGEAIVDANCRIGARCVEMDLHRTIFKESPYSEPITRRMEGIHVRLCRQEFVRQAGLRSLTPKEVEEALRLASERASFHK